LDKGFNVFVGFPFLVNGNQIRYSVSISIDMRKKRFFQLNGVFFDLHNRMHQPPMHDEDRHTEKNNKN
jgi:hypothetical protein